MRRAQVTGRTVTVKVRFADFTTITRSRTLDEATDVTLRIHETATALFRGLGLQRARIRLVGVRVEGLTPRTRVFHQLALGEPDHGWPEADRAVDRAVTRFGAAAVQPASLMSTSRAREARTEGARPFGISA
jgi:DNA polymerase-4